MAFVTECILPERVRFIQRGNFFAENINGETLQPSAESLHLGNGTSRWELRAGYPSHEPLGILTVVATTDGENQPTMATTVKPPLTLCVLACAVSRRCWICFRQQRYSLQLGCD